MPMFRVTRPYLNLLVKPRIFIKFLQKAWNNTFFPEKKNVCLPYTYLKFSDLLPETYLFFYLA